MTRPNQTNVPQDEPILIQEQDLPLSCPGPKAPLWSLHPRVYIEIGHTREALCPYCGAHYRLAPDAQVPGH